MHEMAFISFRLPKADRDKLRLALTEDTRTLQEFMQGLVSDSLAARERQGARLPDVVKTLRSRREELAGRHVAHLWVFGSVARGEERADSDIDIVVEFDADARISLVGFARLQLDLSDLLGHPVDLAQWRTLRPHVTEKARNDAVMVF